MACRPQTNVPMAGKARPASSLARATPLTGRLMLCLGLLFLIPALSFQACEWFYPWIPFDDIQGVNLSFVVLVVGAGLWLWRRFVRWTLGRAAATAVTVLVPLAQVLWWQPMFNVGCVTDDILRTGQNLSLVGLWVWVAVWLWWGLDRGWAVIRTRWPLGGDGRRMMTPTARSLAAGMGLLPFLVGLWLILLVFLTDVVSLGEDEHAVIICNGVCAVVAVVVWILIWRHRVAWTRRARIGTILSSGVLLHVAVLVPLYYVLRGDSDGEVGVVALPVVALGIWLLFTAFLWPARAVPVQERIEAGVRCTRCGYSLRGLTGTRCPECGYEPTLESFCAGWVTEEGL